MKRLVFVAFCVGSLYSSQPTTKLPLELEMQERMKKIWENKNPLSPRSHLCYENATYQARQDFMNAALAKYQEKSETDAARYALGVSRAEVVCREIEYTEGPVVGVSEDGAWQVLTQVYALGIKKMKYIEVSEAVLRKAFEKHSDPQAYEKAMAKLGKDVEAKIKSEAETVNRS